MCSTLLLLGIMGEQRKRRGLNLSCVSGGGIYYKKFVPISFFRQVARFLEREFKEMLAVSYLVLQARRRSSVFAMLA